MKILKKAVALLLTVLLAFSSMSVLASAAFDPAVDDGFALDIQIKLFRNNGTDWVEVQNNKLKPGEAVKARVFMGTDYFSDSGAFICYYDTEFFTSAYTSSATTLSVNQTTGSVSKTHDMAGNVKAFIDNGPPVSYNGTSIYDDHVGLMAIYNFSPTSKVAKLDIDEWLFEFDLQVLSAPDANFGGVFVESSTIMSTTNQSGTINVPKAEENSTAGGLGSFTMRAWDADVTLINNDVFDDTVNDSNFGEINNTITFDANGGAFTGGADTTVKTGLIGSSITFSASVANPTRDQHSFIGWYPESVTDPTEEDCVASDEFDYTALTYMALWKAADVTITFDANGGKFPDNETTKALDFAKGSPITAPADPVRDGFTFGGWIMNDAFDMLEPGVTPAPVYNSRFIARWVPVSGTPYKVVVNYYNVATESNATRAFDYSGTTGHTVNIVESIPATPTVDNIYHAYSNFALTNYELDAADTRNEFTEVIEGNGTTVLNLYYKVKKYTATFDPDGGKFANGSTDDYTSTQDFYSYVNGPAANPSKTGYTFNGWMPTYTANETRLLKDTTFTAQWVPNKYKATFMVGTTKYTETDVEFGANIPLPPAPAGTIIAGNTFGGWTPTPQTMDSIEGKVFTAILIPISYTATFDANGGSFTSGTTNEADYNFDDIIVAPPETPTNGALTFGGWFTAGGTQFVAGTTRMPASDITYLAKWTGAGTHTATFNAGEGKFGDNTSVKSENYAEGSYIGAPGAATREGYDFIKWVDSASSADYVAGTTKMGSANVTFNAVWAKKVTVTYNANGELFEDFNVHEGDAIPTPENDPEKTGNEFTGWELTEGTIPAGITTVPGNDLVYTAQFTPIDYDITYSYTGAVPADAPAAPAAATAQYEDTVTVENAPADIDGFTFSGWSTDDAVVSGGSFSMPAGNVAFTGSWSPVGAEEYALKYYTGADNLYRTQYYEEGEAIVLPTPPESAGKTFAGWTTDPAAETAVAVPPTMPANDVNAYALWNINSYKATYMADGVIYQEYPQVLYGAEIPVPTDPTKDGMIFAGWQPGVPSTMPANDVTFTAQWTAEPGPGEYTVTYYKAFGKTFYAATASEGAPVPKPSSDPTLFGHNFVRWDPEVPATMPAQNLEFNAKWEVDDTFVAVVIGGTVISGTVIGVVSAITAGTVISVIGGAIVVGVIAHALKDTYTVTYKVDGDVYKTYKVAAGAKVPTPTDPEKAGYKFKGWKPEVPEKMPKNDLTFEAQWAKEGVSAEFPDTGSAFTGITAFALISSAAAAAYVVMMRKRKEA